MGGLPDVLFVIDASHEHIAIAEAETLGYTSNLFVDTNTLPAGVDYLSLVMMMR